MIKAILFVFMGVSLSKSWAIISFTIKYGDKNADRLNIAKPLNASRPTASNCAARRGGHHFYSMISEMAGKCAFPLRRKPRRH